MVITVRLFQFQRLTEILIFRPFFVNVVLHLRINLVCLLVIVDVVRLVSVRVVPFQGRSDCADRSLLSVHRNGGVSKYLKGGGRYVHRVQAGFKIGHRKQRRARRKVRVAPT